MPNTLKEAIDRNFQKEKVRIGFTDLSGYSTDAFKQKKKIAGTKSSGGKLLGDATTNLLSDVSLAGEEKNGFIEDDKLKQGVLNIEAFGAVMLQQGNDNFLAGPACTSNLPGGAGGKVSSTVQCCPLTAQASDIEGDFAVGALLDISTFG